MKLTLNTPLSLLPRIGEKYFKKFHKLGLNTIQDLIYHFPHRYDDFSKIITINQLKTGETATVQGKIIDINQSHTFRRRILLTEALIQDKTGSIKAIWFNQPFISRTLKLNTMISLSGKLKIGSQGHYISNPSYEIIKFNKDFTHTAGLVPVYPETAGITSRVIRYAIKLSFPVIKEIKDFLLLEIRKRQNLLFLPKALKEVHFPKNKNLAEKARKRLAFDELFLIQLSAIKQKRTLEQQNAYSIKFNKKLVQNFVNQLPFELTNGQKIASWEILKDLSRQIPMNRLLNGDVGSGKTIIAAIAALEIAKAGYQVAIMAPTEILAQQHFREIGKLLKKYKLNIGLLTRSESNTQNKKLNKKELLNKISNGNIDILIGTHALIQKTVKFKNLALAIIDEQHRFGVKQRAFLQKNLKNKAQPSHFLTLTATPIPRTLCLTIYGDLDISLLKEMPKNRQKIITKIVPPTKRRQAYEFIRKEVKKGHQVFVICPRIEFKKDEESDLKQTQISAAKLLWSEVKAVKQEYEKLNKEIFPDLKIAMLHGKLKSKEKQQVMQNFKNKKTDVLVSTSVVEVGIDIPNATIMMIEGADRFGLAQLYQFRGRVGRSKYQSYCFLFSVSGDSNSRLLALEKCKNGFELAEKDLQIRGPGELYGVRQSGLPDLAMANLGNIKLVEQTRKEANDLLDQDPELKNNPLLQQKLVQFQATIHFE